MLNPKNETSLIMAYDILNMFLNSDCKDFIENFCVRGHQRNVVYGFFLCCIHTVFFFYQGKMLAS
jgi:hypothetical protein